MAGAVSLARTMTDPVAKQKVLDTVRDHSDGEFLIFCIRRVVVIILYTSHFRLN